MSMVVSAKKGSSSIEQLLLYFNFESFDKYYQGTDVLKQSMKLIFFKKQHKKEVKWGFFKHGKRVIYLIIKTHYYVRGSGIALGVLNNYSIAHGLR